MQRATLETGRDYIRRQQLRSHRRKLTDLPNASTQRGSPHLPYNDELACGMLRKKGSRWDQEWSLYYRDLRVGPSLVRTLLVLDDQPGSIQEKPRNEVVPKPFSIEFFKISYETEEKN